ncbi:MAG: imidazole glycerol phosphate synthase, glutamine amidotransferase subunit [Candidatus Staskawiczbacteria bacterium RIFCSPLOWO2_12_FULL_37_15]|uniref:Imidazole glycerol phosphate synthase subunit HisH n=1 Tax=Candidatus Staskawiczbacteria bacterium RIFCSPLOWO2_12_FULL_37_15 TaxID=1802218 RepID=A0A1G2INQ5_9BACT|nr:MAG: imidazole glycerol phosphate synthase, glutamine amidotransferase subunit [Candidatus Staskawiczbacteria bacterium RIFCSPLOWO2_12_FULL_37_15]HXK41151.1 imidazole glycerol phosphate synthase subunit HisH [Candidatus Paceibacterota bacterium]
MSNSKIVIVDYGVGNFHSLYKAVSLFSKDVVLSEEAIDIERASALILPGDGAFGTGMAGLKVRKLIEPVKNFISSGRPVMGICLGAQILLTHGFEFGKVGGLNVISGDVVKFSDLRKGTKIPHIGWNTFSTFNKSPILKGLGGGSYFYFVHSYIMRPQSDETILAISKYGGRSFPAIIGKDNVYGCQFHPEKSGEDGLKIIENFVNLI